MAAGLLAGAIGGLGKAMQHNAQGQIEEKRKKALMALEQENRMELEETRHQNTLSRDEGQHGYRMDEIGQRHEYGLEELGERHGYSMEQERYRQGQQNARHNSSLSARQREGSNDWQMVKTEGGGLVQYSPSRNAYRDANLPDGAMMGGMDGELSDRARYRLDMLSDQAQALREKQAEGLEPLTKEEKIRLGRLEAEMSTMLGSGGGRTILEELKDGEEGGGGGTPAPSGQGGNGDGSAPPPRPDAPTSFDDVAAPVRQQRREQGLVRAAQEEAQTIENEITEIRGLAAQTSFGPRTTSQRREQLAQEVRARMDALMQQHELTEAQQGRLEDAVATILQRVGQ